MLVKQQSMLDKIDGANLYRENRKQTKMSLLIDKVILNIPLEIKNEFYYRFGSEDIELLRSFIMEFINNEISHDILIDDVDENFNRTSLNSKYSLFIKKKEIQINRWYKTALLALEEKKSIALKHYKSKDHKDINYDEYKKEYIELIDLWRFKIKIMTKYPYYDYLYGKRSYSGALRYDIGEIIFTTIFKESDDFTVYTQVTDLVNMYLPYSRKKNEVMVEENSETKELMVTTRINQKNRVIYEQITLESLLSLSTLDSSEKEELLLNAKTQLASISNTDSFKLLVKENSYILQSFDTEDMKIIQYLFSQINNDFYIHRYIIICEYDTLVALGKDPTQSKNRKWLRNRLEKLKFKGSFIMTREKNNILFETKNIVQNIDKLINVENNRKAYLKVYISEVVHNRILQEDTINVYKKEFESMDRSDFPNATLLIYQLQSLRIGLFQLNKTKSKLHINYFIDCLNLINKNKVTQLKEISNCLTEFKKNSVIIKNFNYIDKENRYSIEFLPLTSTDLSLLVNTRKDYSSQLKNILEITT